MAADATSTDTRKKALLGMPGYGQVTGGAARGFFRSSAKLDVVLRMQESSLLAQNFNALWCEALNLHRKRGLDYFAMSHADVEPQDGWLDTLVEELEATVAANLQRATRLRQSILQKAFEGKLASAIKYRGKNCKKSAINALHLSLMA